MCSASVVFFRAGRAGVWDLEYSVGVLHMCEVATFGCFGVGVYCRVYGLGLLWGSRFRGLRSGVLSHSSFRV